jgi:SAM-dependent methyltransferase
MFAAGARRVIAIDGFPELRQRPREAEIYARLMASFAPEARARACRALRPEGVGPGVDPLAISYLGDCRLEASGAIPAASADLVVSHVALEYVWDLDAAVAAIQRLLRPGGLSIHVCSLASQGGVPDHEDRPLGLLEYSPRLWRLMFSNRGVNRVRAPELRKRFADGGLDEVACTVLQALPLAQVQAARPRLHAAFAALSDHDLATLRLRLVSRKLG